MAKQNLPVTAATIGPANLPARVHQIGEFNAGTRAAVILLPAIHGVNDYILDVAQELARAGYSTILIDIHSPGGMPDLSSPAAIGAAVANLDDTRVLAAVAAAVEHAKARTSTDLKVGALGFCIGGTHALLAASEVPGIDAAVGYYGMLRYNEKTAQKPFAPMDRAAQVRAPLLYQLGDNDPWVDANTLDQYTNLLREHAVHHEVAVYRGAGHAFHEHHRLPVYRAVAARTSWSNTVTFLNWHLRRKRGGGSPGADPVTDR